MTNAPGQRTALRALTAMVLLGVASVFVTAIKPLMVTGYKDWLHYADDVAGYLLAMEFGAEVLMLIVVSTGIQRWNRRTLALLGLSTIIAGNLFSLVADNFTTLACCRVLAGLGTGIGGAVMSASLAGTEKPTRNFSIYLLSLMSVVMLAFLVLPKLLDRYGLDSIFLMLIAVTIPAVATLHWLPRFAPAAVAGLEARLNEGSRSLLNQPALLMLAAAVGYSIAYGSYWPFVGEVGRSAGLDTITVGYLLAGAQFGGCLSAFSAAILDVRWGRSIPTASAIGGLVACLAALLIWKGTSTAVVITTLAFNPLYLFLYPYVNGVTSHLDPSGRLTVMAVVLQSLCLAVGPAIAGWLNVTTGNYDATIVLALAGFAVSGVLILRVTLRMAKSGASGEPVACNAADYLNEGKS